MTVQEFRVMLIDEYFEKLDDDGTEYQEFDDAGEGYLIGHVKDDFTIDFESMAKELGYESFPDYMYQKLKQQGIEQPQFVRDWAKERVYE